jgi:peptidoglycan/LPS O-acetylase OafA/YrhL
VVWTLALEWSFYLLLPFLAWFARKSRRLIYLGVCFSGLWFFSKFCAGRFFHLDYELALFFAVKSISRYMVIGFGGGILIAAIEPQLKKHVRLSNRQSSSLAALLYLGYLLIPGIGGVGQLLVLGGFALTANGADLFGLLTSRPVRLLGLASYDIYLVHGMIYYSGMRLRGGIHPVGVAAYLAETAASIVILIITAVLLHFAVERPTMKKSERIARGGPERKAIPAVVGG